MKLYYRADTRPPDVIFAEGFKPRETSYTQPWWVRGLKSGHAYGLYDRYPSATFELCDGAINAEQAMEAYPRYVICFTSKIEAAPIFPVLPDPTTDNSTHEIYIYAMSLPEASVPRTLTPSNPELSVIDLHALQIQQTRSILGRNAKLNPAFVAQGLCGYEAFSQSVAPESIICAIKCKRSDLLPHTASLQVYVAGNACSLPFERKFLLDTHIVCNTNFVEDNAGFLKKAAIHKLTEVAKKGVQETSKVAEALASSGITYNPDLVVKKSLFKHYMKYKDFKLAALTLWESTRSFFTSLWSKVTGQTLVDRKNSDIIVSSMTPCLISSEHSLEKISLPRENFRHRLVSSKTDHEIIPEQVAGSGRVRFFKESSNTARYSSADVVEVTGPTQSHIGHHEQCQASPR